ncbi:MAG: DUF11 domain-containing protein [Gammaproteobacteria bacterium]|nr:DUF11 domain-containing protein [Gammaproteobacteria bacterium]
MVNGVQGAGSVYIFALNDGINLNVLQRLFEPQPGHLYGYGQSTATDGRDWVMIGSSTDTPRFHLAGAVYVYRRDAMSGLFVNSQQLTASDVSNAWFFGSAIALGNGFALIGAPGYRTGVPCYPDGTPCQMVGAVYVFTEDSASGQWTQSQVIPDPIGGAYDQFGRSIALDGDTALVAADYQMKSGQGRAAYVLTRAATGVWSIAQALDLPADAPSCFVWTQVALRGSTALVGITSCSGVGSRALVYTYDAAAGRWQLSQQIAPCAPNAVSLSNSRALITCQGDLQVFDQDPVSGLWQRTQTIPPPPSANNFTSFGAVLAEAGGGLWLASDAAAAPSVNPGEGGIVYVLGPSVDLHLEGQANPAQITAGETVSYIFTVTNNDPALTATNLELHFTLPGVMTIVSSTGANCQTSSGTQVLCTLGNLMPGATRATSLMLAVDRNDVMSISTSVTVDADQGDANPADNGLTLFTDVKPAPPKSGGGGMGLWPLIVLLFAFGRRLQRQL